jgi:hypothetical protein
MLLLPEEKLPGCSKAIRAEATGTSLDDEIDAVIAAILVARFSGCSALTPSQRARSQALWLTVLDRDRPGMGQSQNTPLGRLGNHHIGAILSWF